MGERDVATLADATLIDGFAPSELKLTVPPLDELANASASDMSPAHRGSLVGCFAKNDARPATSRYEVGPTIGSGGVGTVLLARDRDLGRPVAMKQLHAAEPTPAQLERFLREAQVTAQLEHPGIVPVHDVGVDEAGKIYYVMRFVRGEQTLGDLIEKLRQGDPTAHATFTFERRVQLIQQVAQILDYAHSRGIVHRDVKPENIMLGPFGEVYLVDWGIAKILAGPELSRDEERPTHDVGPVEAMSKLAATSPGRLLGTPLYMSPEQANGDPATPRSDVFSLTAVLYELLTLHHYLGDVADSRSLGTLLDEVITGQHAKAESFLQPNNGRVPRCLSIVCDRGLARDPAERMVSAKELHERLQNFLEGGTPILCPATLLLATMAAWRAAIHRRPVVVTLATFWAAIPLLVLAAFVYPILRLAVWSPRSRPAPAASGPHDGRTQAATVRPTA